MSESEISAADMAAAVMPPDETADDMLLLCLYTASDIAAKLYALGDGPGAFAMATFVQTLESFRDARAAQIKVAP